jgi:gas vesicle protein
MTKNDVGSFFIGVSVGLVIGGIAGLLFAPQSGKETRRKLVNKAKAIKDRVHKPKNLDDLHIQK